MQATEEIAANRPDVAQVTQWLVEKLAQRLEVEPAQVDVDMLFPDFGLDSTEVLVLAGELEHWLGYELAPTAMWYNPTVARLAAHIVDEQSAAD